MVLNVCVFFFFFLFVCCFFFFVFFFVVVVFFFFFCLFVLFCFGVELLCCLSLMCVFICLVKFG